MVSEDSAPNLGSVSVGSLIAGYRLEEQIGLGGMAVVFRARDESLGRMVALKVMAPMMAGDEAFRQRFLRESRAAAAVDDPHIIPVHEAGDVGGTLFIAMRYVAITPDGKTVYTANSGNGTITPISLATHVIGTPISVPGTAPWAIAIAPDGRTAYVGTVSGKLVAINLAAGTASCSPPPPPRSAPDWAPTNCCAASATCVSAWRATRATTRAAWSGCSSQDCASPPQAETSI